MSGKTPGYAAGLAYAQAEAMGEPPQECWEAAAQAAIAADADPTAQDYDNAAEILKLRDLVADILGQFHYLHGNVPGYRAEFSEVRMCGYRKRAAPEPAIATAGTEHLIDPGDPRSWQKVADMPARER